MLRNNANSIEFLIDRFEKFGMALSLFSVIPPGNRTEFMKKKPYLCRLLLVSKKHETNTLLYDKDFSRINYIIYLQYYSS